MEKHTNEKYFVFSSDICNLNQEVTANDVANNLFVVIKAAVDAGAKVSSMLTLLYNNIKLRLLLENIVLRRA